MLPDLESDVEPDRESIGDNLEGKEEHETVVQDNPEESTTQSAL